jgi:SAM-dependent methyltransferase
MPDYFEQHHHGSFWRQRGDQPLLYRRRLRVIADTVGAGRRTLLDVGSGEGWFAKRASAAGWHVVALDYLHSGAVRTRAHVSRVVRGSAERVPLSSETFDAVTAWDLLEHLHAPAAAIREIHRVLRRGGAFAFSTPNPEARSVRCRGRDSVQFTDETHVSISPADDWKKWLEEAGFRVARLGTDTWWDPPYPPSRVPAAAYKLRAQWEFATRFTSERRRDGENIVGLAVKDGDLSV